MRYTVVLHTPYCEPCYNNKYYIVSFVPLTARFTSLASLKIYQAVKRGIKDPNNNRHKTMHNIPHFRHSISCLNKYNFLEETKALNLQLFALSHNYGSCASSSLHLFNRLFYFSSFSKDFQFGHRIIDKQTIKEFWLSLLVFQFDRFIDQNKSSS